MCFFPSALVAGEKSKENGAGAEKSEQFDQLKLEKGEILGKVQGHSEISAAGPLNSFFEIEVASKIWISISLKKSGKLASFQHGLKKLFERETFLRQINTGGVQSTYD